VCVCAGQAEDARLAAGAELERERLAWDSQKRTLMEMMEEKAREMQAARELERELHAARTAATEACAALEGENLGLAEQVRIMAIRVHPSGGVWASGGLRSACAGRAGAAVHDAV
jgi:hypothetical protein